MPISSDNNATGSNFDDPSKWRLKTALKQVPYKLLKTKYKLSQETGTGSGFVELLVPANKLYKFLEDVLPSPKLYGNIFVTEFVYYPFGIDDPGTIVSDAKAPILAILDADIESWDDERPNDAFGADPDAPCRTYNEVMKVTLNLGCPPNGKVDPDNPKTFLEISAEETGDFVHVPATALVQEDVKPTTTGFTLGVPDGKQTAVRDPNIPWGTLQPSVTWSLKWKNIPKRCWDQVIHPRMKQALGKLNKTPFKPLDDAPKGSLLFLGFEWEQVYSWYNDPKLTTDFQTSTAGDLNDLLVLPLVTVHFKILEKIVINENESKIYGHQSFFIPDQNAYRWVSQNGKPTFQYFDFNKFFESQIPLQASILPDNVLV